MKSIFTLNAQEFGAAMKRVVAMHHGINFFPYRIVRSSFRPPLKINVELLNQAKSPRLKKTLSGSEDFERDYTLTREEILHGISSEIRIFKIGQPYKGNCIKQLSVELPDEVTIRLQAIPREAKRKLHIFNSNF